MPGYVLLVRLGTVTSTAFTAEQHRGSHMAIMAGLLYFLARFARSLLSSAGRPVKGKAVVGGREYG